MDIASGSSGSKGIISNVTAGLQESRYNLNLLINTLKHMANLTIGKLGSLVDIDGRSIQCQQAFQHGKTMVWKILV